MLAGRLFVFLISAASALICLGGCGKKTEVKKGLTGVHLVITHDGSMGMDQLRVSAEMNGTEVYAASDFPDAPSGPLDPKGESLVFLFSDELAGSSITFQVEGLWQGSSLIARQGSVVLIEGTVIPMTIHLAEQSVCGDGHVDDSSEECDDENTDYGDGCSDECRVEPGYSCAGEPSVCTLTCGNGVVDGSDACDDGGVQDGDGCSSVCRVEPGYSCAGEPSVCVTSCGDGIPAGQEECDDGGSSDGDGCDAQCAVETGWTCEWQPSECSPICGDGMLVGDEDCDDANETSGDGCSMFCATEPDFRCTGEPSVCTHACESDSDCDFICDEPEGFCVHPSEILFVRCGGSCPGSGTTANPYCHLQDGVDASTDGQFIYVYPSVCNEEITISGVDLTVVGGEDTIIGSATCPTVLIQSAQVELRSIHVRGAGAYETVQGGGVRVESNGSLRFIRSISAPSDCVGVACLDSRCDIHQSVVGLNKGGGIQIQDSDYVVMNSFLPRNGDDDTEWGSVLIDAPSSTVAYFYNNTVVGGLCQDEAGRVGGVYCVSQAAIVNSILWTNRRLEVLGSCNVRYSTIQQPGFQDVDGNSEEPPMFEDIQNGDFHLTAGSPCIDAGDPAGAPPAPAVDYDGEARPQGLGVDMGADEAQ